MTDPPDQGEPPDEEAAEAPDRDDGHPTRAADVLPLIEKDVA